MEIFALIFGLSIVGIGFLVKKYPSLISGYNTMSAQKKKNVDIESIATLYKKAMIIIGVITIVLPFIFSQLNLPTLVVISLIAPLFVGLFILLLLTPKYDHNKQSKFKKYISAIIVGALIVIVSTSLFISSFETKVIISDNNIEFTGQYGLTIDKSEIKEVKLLNMIPRITMRTNGLGLGNILKGHFRLDKFGKCRLFLVLPNPPYLYIELKDGKKILFNSKDSLYTKDKYRKLLTL